MISLAGEDERQSHLYPDRCFLIVSLVRKAWLNAPAVIDRERGLMVMEGEDGGSTKTSAGAL